ncbi:MAG: acyl-CoA dehydrogenase family protein, partial [Myxococcota bacterium]|nr:acyl-CoA dehydrogenase family protein [Myxococcota bacterium]
MFVLTEEQEEIKQGAKESAERILSETAKEDDESEIFRPAYMKQLGEDGYCGIPTAERYDGYGAGYLEYALVLEEIAKVSASYAVSVAVSGLPQVILAEFGTDAQRERWMPGLATGDLLGAFALSEPDSGSDAASLQTSAVLHGDKYVLNGRKFWITHGGFADVYVVMARTGGSGPKGVSSFLMPKDAPGLSFGKKEEKMGLRASPTVEMVIEDVALPVSARIGPEGIGFNVAMTALNSGRITIGAIAVGLAQAALEQASSYACIRKQFNKQIIDFQGVGFMLADMAMQTEAARLLVHKAAYLKDNGFNFMETASMAKCYATDAAMSVCTDAVQVFGGYGYTREYPVERYMRDAKVMQIVEGTN